MAYIDNKLESGLIDGSTTNVHVHHYEAPGWDSLSGDRINNSADELNLPIGVEQDGYFDEAWERLGIGHFILYKCRAEGGDQVATGILIVTHCEEDDVKTMRLTGLARFTYTAPE